MVRYKKPIKKPVKTPWKKSDLDHSPSASKTTTKKGGQQQLKSSHTPQTGNTQDESKLVKEKYEHKIKSKSEIKSHMKKQKTAHLKQLGIESIGNTKRPQSAPESPSAKL